MSGCAGKDSWGQAMYWAAMAIVPFRFMGGEHSNTAHFVMGFAAGLFLVGLLRFVWLRAFRR